MIIAIASGKGGTGKTTVATNLAVAIGQGQGVAEITAETTGAGAAAAKAEAKAKAKVQLLDCDVEEPNDHLFFDRELEIHKEVAVTSTYPEIDSDRCTRCGKCAELCAFNALAVVGDSVLVFPEMCHACGACAHFCPEGAVVEVSRDIGGLRLGRAGDIDVHYGLLNVGEAMAPPVIKALKREVAAPGEGQVSIVDAPPGTSCPVIESIKGSDYVVLVTEPTPFGLHDLELAAGVVEQLGMPAGVVINRSDIGDDSVERFCAEKGLPVLMRIPFDRELAAGYARGEIIAEKDPGWRRRFQELYGKIREAVAQ